MFKILICDDEGIVIESLRFIIEKNFPGQCLVETAKSGRKAIEIAEEFRPNLLFMDIQMPGINGIEAIRAIKEIDSNVECVILTAFDKFGYAQEAIELGVSEYLTKPMNREKVVEIIKHNIKELEARKRKYSHDLAMKEKLETVIPIIENGFIYNVLLQDDLENGNQTYEELLGLQGKNYIVMVVESGEERLGNSMTNPIGSTVTLQKKYISFREIIKEFFDAIIGAVMGNKVIMCISASEDQSENEYEKRVELIEKTRIMERKLEQRLGLKFRIGIGSEVRVEELAHSYREALSALRQSIGKVTHIKDLSVRCEYEEEYPIDVEKDLFEAIQKGNEEIALVKSKSFMEWLERIAPEIDQNVRLKVVEFVLRAEKIAYEHGGMKYYFDSRGDYLDAVLESDSYITLTNWFVNKVSSATRNVNEKREEKTSDIIKRAKEYIETYFDRELSLHQISREVGISPYYFSKLFKEENGQNYSEYVTELRIKEAKKMLENSEISIKEICASIGYSDPNYFSRIFKKSTGYTPSEYRGDCV